MKYCMNCGGPLADDAAFCGQCGTAVQPVAPQQPEPVYQQPKAPNFFEKSKALIGKIGWIAAVAVLVLAVLLNWVFPWLGTLRYKKMAVALVDAYYCGDYSDLGKYILEESVENKGYDDVDDYIDVKNEYSDTILRYQEQKYGDDFDCNVTICKVQKYSKDQKKDEIEDLADDLDVSKSDIKNVVKVFYMVKIKGDDTVQSPGSFTAYKYEGKWYVYTYIGEADDYDY